MISGLLPLSLIAEYLGKRPPEMPALIKLGKLPVVRVDAETKPISKVPFLAFHGWIVSRSVNKPLTQDELAKELETAAAAMKARAAAKKKGAAQ